jgi:F-type H+-transporting ATPase subunit gamma
MSQLIQMQQRIKAIETIAKVTHAMQLISMSTHLRLRDKKAKIEHYQQALKDIFFQTKEHFMEWSNPILSPAPTDDNHQLVILVGSQKGLCGTFNTNLFYTFEKDNHKNRFPHGHLITVGKKTTEYANAHIKSGKITLQLVNSFQELNWRSAPAVANALFNHIINASPAYNTVLLYGNYPVGFFSQRQHIVTLIPLEFGDQQNKTQLTESSIWWDSPSKVLDAIAYQYLHATIYYLITQSLFAEQAARFISMDNATRNAQHLRENMLLQYNKARQAKITKELTELSSSFQGNFSS